MYNNYFVCPFCNASVPLKHDTNLSKSLYFNMNIAHFEDDNDSRNSYIFEINMNYCPVCRKTSFFAQGNKSLSEININMYPLSSAKQLPKYIPNAIRNDYEEACSILFLSPKASATLSRRCLQGMIRDFWGISKSTLFEEIANLKDKVPLSQWKAIDSIRSIGNIGAHMQKDINFIIEVDPNEAQQLISLIELLFDKWYVSRHDEEELLNKVTSIANSKKIIK